MIHLEICLTYKRLNGNDWILVYGKWKLKVIEVEDFYKDLFIELKDYFIWLLNNYGKINNSWKN